MQCLVNTFPVDSPLIVHRPGEDRTDLGPRPPLIAPYRTKLSNLAPADSDGYGLARLGPPDEVARPLPQLA